MFQVKNIILTNFLVLTILTTALGLVLRDRSALEKTSCNRIVSVESQGVLNYLGSVTFKVPEDFEGQWEVEMETNEPFTFFGSWGVTSKSEGQKKRVNLRSSKVVQLQAGEIVTFRFRISYGRNQPIPYVKMIRWQGQEVCHPVSQLENWDKEMQRDIWTGRRNEKSFGEKLMSFYYSFAPILV